VCPSVRALPLKEREIIRYLRAADLQFRGTAWSFTVNGRPPEPSAVARACQADQENETLHERDAGGRRQVSKRSAFRVVRNLENACSLCEQAADKAIAQKPCCASDVLTLRRLAVDTELDS